MYEMLNDPGFLLNVRSFNEQDAVKIHIFDYLQEYNRFEHSIHHLTINLHQLRPHQLYLLSSIKIHELWKKTKNTRLLKSHFSKFELQEVDFFCDENKEPRKLRNLLSHCYINFIDFDENNLKTFSPLKIKYTNGTMSIPADETINIKNLIEYTSRVSTITSLIWTKVIELSPKKVETKE